MIEMKRWEIWEADVPYEENNGHKKRPVLILSETKVMVVSLKMTSHEPRYHSMNGEYEVMKWREAGLEKPTVIQCSKRLKLEKERFTGKQFGRLSATDIIGMQTMLEYMSIKE